MNDNIKKIGVLGSTGSIGTQTLDIVSLNPSLFKITLLTANKNWRRLAEQTRKFMPEKVVIADETFYKPLAEEIADLPVIVECGHEAIERSVTSRNIDMVVTAMVGYSGLLPTVNAIKAHKNIALANKETLVVAGELITSLAKEHGVEIIPVDSEHSAIFQCMRGESHNDVRKIILTASGGPFRLKTKEELNYVTVEDALNHPNWSMGNKVTVDSASMMNKGFEMIEARWLFNVEPDDIEIVVHPQSIVHSMVEFTDGAVKAQLGEPDMHIPIGYALGFPRRLNSETSRLTLPHYASLTFEAPDYDKFPLLGFAFEAIKKGGNLPCILNAANEKAVEAFLNEKIKFVDMPVLVRNVMQKTPFIKSPDLDDLIETHKLATKIAEDFLNNMTK